MDSQSRVLFLGLTVFSQTGGIEKFNKCFLQALKLNNDNGSSGNAVSVLYDESCDSRYTPASTFKGYKGNRAKFVLAEILNARHFDTIVIGHINLSIVAIAIKKMFPKKKVIIIIHGIEAMERMSFTKRQAMAAADQLWAVSEFTKRNLETIQGIDPQKIALFYNTIDPFFQFPQHFQKPAYLLERYNIKPEQRVLFSLTRLNHNEGYKGYDTVIEALPEICKASPNVRYLIAGKGDDQEVAKIKKLVAEKGLQGRVELLGFVRDEELTDHYLMSDLFVLPSKKEGFGIVFIEAMACGLPVVAGNKDGSVDALRKGELGTLVDPDSASEIAAGVIKNLTDHDKMSGKPLQQAMLNIYGFDQFRQRLSRLLNCTNN
ncbi:MAG: glycosyltransferase family 4 protein [Chitinophagaceae bacterium]|nr:glycosyltransferase family 4 protein [Chitinophagaceae bacterium]